MSRRLLRITRSQQMALVDILVAYLRSSDVQEFVDISTDTTTTTGELLALVGETYEMTPDTFFMDKLRSLMPPKVLEESPDIPLMSLRALPAIRHIRRLADGFVGALNHEMPATQTELANTLWTFGELANGELERRLEHATKIAQDAIYAHPAPLTVKCEHNYPSQDATFQGRVVQVCSNCRLVL